MTGLTPVIRVLTLLLSTAWISGCQDQHEWHQKLTVVLDTPSGMATGFSVVKVKAAFDKLPLSNSEVNYHIEGEATVVEVEPGRYLFALLGGDEERFYRAVREKIGTQDRGEWLKIIPKMDEVITLKPENYPMLVTFHDIDDPKSVSRLSPGEFVTHFGDEVSLKAITLEVTPSPVTFGRVASVLPWLCDYIKRKVSLGNRTGPIIDNELHNNIGTGAFKIGDCR